MCLSYKSLFSHDDRIWAALFSSFLILWFSLFGELKTQAAAQSTFPLQVSENHRYLVDQSGKPFLVVGDTGWSLIAQLGEADVTRYLDDRAGRGFNAIIINLIEHKFASHAPAKKDGIQPFLKPGDFTQPNRAYFDFAYWAVEQAQRRGVSVWLCPAYLGWGGGDEGFFKEIKAAGPAALKSYGHFVGDRFKNLSNIVWMVGGDYALPVSEQWCGNELAAGLREGGARQLITAHGGQTYGVQTFGDQPWLAIDTTYSYATNLYEPLLANYRQQPVRPFVLIESTYEGEHDSRPEQIRRQAWWAMLCGSGGQFFGNNPIWHFDGPTLFPHKDHWAKALSDTGSHDMARLAEFFGNYPWHQLVPDQEEKLVISGRGSGVAKVIAARTADAKSALIYIPADRSQSREIAIDCGLLASSVTARWFNPAREARLIDAVPASNQGNIKSFRTPGNNGADANDWVLVLSSTNVP